MYIPPLFEEHRLPVLHELIRSHPLGLLVVASPEGLEGHHVPFFLSPHPAPHGTLQGHVARTNPVWQKVSEQQSVMVVFSGPEAYVSPSWYPTKQEHGRVVPTWNYAAVHAHGTLRVRDDPAWLRSQMHALTAQQEMVFESPWTMDDAPDDFIERLVQAVVGLELIITRLEGKWKISQNPPPQNQEGVIQGLEASDQPGSMEMAALMRRRGGADTTR